MSRRGETPEPIDVSDRSEVQTTAQFVESEDLGEVRSDPVERAPNPSPEPGSPCSSANSGSNTYPVHKIESLYVQFCIDHYYFRVPRKSENCGMCRPGEMTVFRDAFMAGMSLPFHPVVEELCDLCRISPGQIAPNAWRRVVWFFFACDQAGIEPRLDIFRSVASMQHVRKERNFVAIGFKRCNAPVFPTNIKGWKNKYFFLRPKVGSFRYSEIWTTPFIERFNTPPPMYPSLISDIAKFRRVDAAGKKFGELVTWDIMTEISMSGEASSIHFAFLNCSNSLCLLCSSRSPKRSDAPSQRPF